MLSIQHAALGGLFALGALASLVACFVFVGGALEDINRALRVRRDARRSKK